jgi:hypothetical protein
VALAHLAYHPSLEKLAFRQKPSLVASLSMKGGVLKIRCCRPMMKRTNLSQKEKFLPALVMSRPFAASTPATYICVLGNNFQRSNYSLYIELEYFLSVL